MPLDPRLNAYRPDLADVRLRGGVSADRFIEPWPAQVVASSAPVRSKPADDAMLATEALRGECVSVFEERDGWSWVQLEADRYVGWVPSAALGDIAGPATHRVRVARTFLFSGPDIKTPPLATLSFGALVTAPEEASDRNARYCLVEPQGAVVAQHLAPVGSTEADPVAVARLFLGTPYLWGGKSGAGIDCSGLVQVAFAAAGVPCPRDSDMQAGSLGRALDPRETAELRRGDIVFWPGHVGIMVDAERIIHANAWHMMVAEEPLAEAKARFARRGANVIAMRRVAAE